MSAPAFWLAMFVAFVGGMAAMLALLLRGMARRRRECASCDSAFDHIGVSH